MRGLGTLLSLALFLGSLPVFAAEVGAPLVDHQPVSQGRKGQPVDLRARIVPAGGKAVGEAAALVKVEGIAGFTRIPLKNLPEVPEIYFAQIPAALAGAGFAYYLEAFDAEGNGPGRAGSAEAPFQVTMVSPDLPVEPRIAPPAPAATAAPATAPSTALALSPTALAAPPAVRRKARSQLPTFALFALTGLGLGTGALSQVGYQMYKSQANDVFSGTGDTRYLTARQYHQGEVFGTLSVVSFVVAGLALAGGITYLAWPDAPAAAPQVAVQPAPAAAAPERAPAKAPEEDPFR